MTGDLKAALATINGVTMTIVKVLRSKACGFCGAADGNHRPECADMRAEDESDLPAVTTTVADRMVIDAEGNTFVEFSDYDRNDTAAVAARIAEGGKLDDQPLVPKSVKVTPKRKSNGAAEQAGE
jgi:hypothetical protein